LLNFHPQNTNLLLESAIYGHSQPQKDYTFAIGKKGPKNLDQNY